MITKTFFTFLISGFFFNVFAQNTLKGIVQDNQGVSLPNVNILIKGTSEGSITDFDGNFSLEIDSFPVTLIVSYVGFLSQEITVSDASPISIKMMEDNVSLDELILLGNRSKPRTVLNSPVAIDNISVKDLNKTAKPFFERMLTFSVPSFNSQNQAISDATAHYDPADLRGLGPSRTLVLINGKRKNQSAQVYLNRTPGKGEVGIDLKSIPRAAIERIEVLRDGASAQYGSDAIAGVMNIILKKDINLSTFNVSSGITDEGDGFNFLTSYNTGLGLGEEGFLNISLDYYKQQLTNRAGMPGVSDVPDNPRSEWTQWATENPDLGMHVGQPDMDIYDFLVNAGHPIGKNAEFYTTNSFTTRTGRSFAYYRAPYWRTDVADSGFITTPENFIGYQPTFETNIDDYFNVIGVKKVSDTNDFTIDISLTHGLNTVEYIVNNSVNRDYLRDKGTSPRTFYPGGYAFRNLIGNIDFSKSFSENISSSFGIEYKRELFTANEGNPLSYYKGGSDSFAGIKPEEAGTWSRNNTAAYFGVDYESNNFLLGIAGRYEDFTDFGSNFSYKAQGRFNITENAVLRGSYSTGFRAPSLHQRYLRNTQYIIIAGSSEPLLQGTLENTNPALRALGVKELFAETSQNISLGGTYKIGTNFLFSLDLYQINVADRILFSSQIGKDSDDTTINSIEKILNENNLTAIQFFINAGDTKTQGVDIVSSYKNLTVGKGYLDLNFLVNLNQTTIETINTPDALKANNYNIFERIEEGLITNSRPQSKYILSLDYTLDNWAFRLANTRFGSVTITAPNTTDYKDQTLSPVIGSDFSITYSFTPDLNINATVNNIFDVYPDKTLASTGTAQAGTRFVYSSEVQQIGQLGRNYALSLNYIF